MPPMSKQSDKTLRQHVTTAMEQYFTNLAGHEPSNLYELVLKEIEAPLIASALKFTNNNQLKTAKILGLSRGTLRKKIQLHQLMTSKS